MDKILSLKAHSSGFRLGDVGTEAVHESGEQLFTGSWRERIRKQQYPRGLERTLVP
jgi:hypothetical protein